MLNSLSRNRTLPQIVPRCGCLDPLPGRLPYQGYESPCSGRHYCLRGMDYCTTGEHSTERRLRPLCSQQPTVRFAGIRPPCPGSTHKRAPPPRVPPYSAAGTPSVLFPRQTPIRFCLLLGPQGTSEQLRQRTSTKVTPKSSTLSFPTALKVKMSNVCILKILQKQFQRIPPPPPPQSVAFFPYTHVLDPWVWRQRF